MQLSRQVSLNSLVAGITKCKGLICIQCHDSYTMVMSCRNSSVDGYINAHTMPECYWSMQLLPKGTIYVCVCHLLEVVVCWCLGAR